MLPMDGRFCRLQLVLDELYTRMAEALYIAESMRDALWAGELDDLERMAGEHMQLAAKVEGYGGELAEAYRAAGLQAESAEDFLLELRRADKAYDAGLEERCIKIAYLAQRLLLLQSANRALLDELVSESGMMRSFLASAVGGEELYGKRGFMVDEKGARRISYSV